MDYYKSLGYGRSKTIPTDCDKCKEFGICIDKMLSPDYSSNELLTKYLTKAIDLECMSSNNCPCASDAMLLAKKIGQLLISTEQSQLTKLLKEAKNREPITTENIPQYGDLSIAMYGVPEILLEHNNIGYIDFGRLLFYHEGKRDDAYRKYAENHCKLATLLDLAVIKRHAPFGTVVSSSVMGRYFSSLPIEDRDKLLPKLCLRIPIVQEALISNNRSESINNSLSILSESTRIRRRKGVVDIIQFAMDE